MVGQSWVYRRMARIMRPWRLALAAMLCAMACAEGARADAVTDWNQELLVLIQQSSANLSMVRPRSRGKWRS